jgi:hypothetical protein
MESMPTWYSNWRKLYQVGQLGFGRAKLLPVKVTAESSPLITGSFIPSLLTGHDSHPVKQEVRANGVIAASEGGRTDHCPGLSIDLGESIHEGQGVWGCSQQPHPSGPLPRLSIFRPNRGNRQFSVEALKGNVRSASSGLGTSQHHSWKLHVDDFVPHRIQHQLDGGMKLELEHDIASMRFYRCQ